MVERGRELVNERGASDSLNRKIYVVACVTVPDVPVTVSVYIPLECRSPAAGRFHYRHYRNPTPPLTIAR